jgi:hypothetical protein
MAHANGAAKLFLRKDKDLLTILVRGTLVEVSDVPEHKAFCLISGQFGEQVEFEFPPLPPKLGSAQRCASFRWCRNQE